MRNLGWHVCQHEERGLGKCASMRNVGWASVPPAPAAGREWALVAFCLGAGRAGRLAEGHECLSGTCLAPAYVHTFDAAHLPPAGCAFRGAPPGTRAQHRTSWMSRSAPRSTSGAASWPAWSRTSGWC